MSENKLKQSFDLHAIESIITSTKDSAKQIIGWKIIGDQKITIDLEIKILRKNRDEIVLVSENISKTSLLEMLANGSDKINIYLPEDMALFQSDVKSFEKENGRITISYPKMFAQVERRKHLRLFLTEELPVPISFHKSNQGHNKSIQFFTKTCFDISAGGLSFIASKIEQKFFQEKDKIEKIKISLDDKEFLLDAEVINILDIEPNDKNKLHYRGFKICLQFKDLDHEKQKFINSYVFRNSHIEKQVI